MRTGLTLIGVGLILIGLAVLMPALLTFQGSGFGAIGFVSLSIGLLAGLGTITIGIGVIVLGQNLAKP